MGVLGLLGAIFGPVIADKVQKAEAKKELPPKPLPVPVPQPPDPKPPITNTAVITPSPEHPCVYQGHTIEIPINLSLAQKELPESAPIVCENFPPGSRMKAQFIGSWVTKNQPAPHRWIDVAIHEKGKLCPVPDWNNRPPCLARAIENLDFDKNMSEVTTIPDKGDDKGKARWVLQVVHCESDKSTPSFCDTIGGSKLEVSVVPDGS